MCVAAISFYISILGSGQPLIKSLISVALPLICDIAVTKCDCRGYVTWHWARVLNLGSILSFKYDRNPSFMSQFVTGNLAMTSFMQWRPGPGLRGEIKWSRDYHSVCSRYPGSGPANNVISWSSSSCGHELDSNPDRHSPLMIRNDEIFYVCVLLAFKLCVAYSSGIEKMK